jgi:hypothetical protein
MLGPGCPKRTPGEGGDEGELKQGQPGVEMEGGGTYVPI